ncbi:glycosyltransferase family 4 protein [Tessaracoccus sp. OS52]|uniref:glycosyltransferase family 4 protein n=1 Tax=Tessaracoccus sp. OS52 TaxID=2886691 RepID=UPI001D12EA0C|nr:glycosyltransferase family 4 protein [Tessaracoccus sp. OS52]MCC2592934.1 glycosyltransferase family 4 protein [Tessaracoccus sp. OS52]
MSLITEAEPEPVQPVVKSLRIGMVAPPWYSIPPKGYGGIEVVVGSLVDQLVKLGHHVTLVASGEPGTSAQGFVQIYEEPPSHLLGSDVMPELVNAAKTQLALADLELDVIHDHSAAGPLSATARRCPTVVTMHGPVAGTNGEYYRSLGRTIQLVAISGAQRRQARDMNWVGTVHNAVDVASFPFKAEKSDHVLWLGRFSPDKGAHLAIETARRAGRRIILAGKLNETAEREYFDEVIEPLLGPGVEYVGEADAAMKRELFADAACLLFPIQWEEPFGMVMAEALACGTPVVATPRGSVPEIVRPGRTGFIAEDLDGLVQALQRISEIDPAACRADAEARFDLPVMAHGYERVYRRVLARTGSPLQRLDTTAA